MLAAAAEDTRQSVVAMLPMPRRYVASAMPDTLIFIFAAAAAGALMLPPCRAFSIFVFHADYAFSHAVAGHTLRHAMLRFSICYRHAPPRCRFITPPLPALMPTRYGYARDTMPDAEAMSVGTVMGEGSCPLLSP